MTRLVSRIKPYLKVFLNNYTPRWLILAIDLAIVFITFAALWVFRSSLSPVPYNYFTAKAIIILAIYFVTSISYKTYRGVVRFSSTTDFHKLVLSTLTATGVYVALDVFGFYSNHILRHAEIQLWFPILHGLTVVSGQIIFRLSVKSVFQILEGGSFTTPVKPILIMGADAESVQLATTITFDRNAHYKPVAFIIPSVIEMESGATSQNRENQEALVTNGNGRRSSKKEILGLPVVEEYNNITEITEKFKVNTLLVNQNHLHAISREFFDRCIVQGVEVLLANSIKSFDPTRMAAAPQINKIKIEDLLGRNVIETDKTAIAIQLRGERVLVTGAAGSIGSEIARQALRYNCKELLLVDQAETPLNDLWLELKGERNPNTEIYPIVASVTLYNRMKQVFEEFKPTIVYHAAAYKHVPMMEHHPSTAAVTNIFGTKNLTSLAVQFKVKHFVMISTDKAVNPTNVMGATKRAAEIYVQSVALSDINKNGTTDKEGTTAHITNFVTTRFGNVLGSNGSVVPHFRRQIEKGGPVTLTHKEITRYFMTIPEACSLVLEAGAMGNNGEIYIFDMGEAIKISDLAEKMIHLAGKVPGRDIEIIETGLRPGEKLYEELLADKENTLPTHHPKIMIAKVEQRQLDQTEPLIDKIIKVALQYNDPEKLVKLIKELVPEFISQNSRFEELDKVSSSVH